MKTKLFRPPLEIEIEWLENTTNPEDNSKEILDTILIMCGSQPLNRHSTIRVIPLDENGNYEIRQYLSTECKKHGQYNNLQLAVQSAEALANDIVGDGSTLQCHYGRDKQCLRDGS